MATDYNKILQGDLQSTDWQSHINQAKSEGNMTAAAQLEAKRNEKINSKGYTGSQTTTNNYSAYLPKTNASTGATYTRTDGDGVYGVPVINSDIKNYKQNGVTYSVGADMSRREDLAGKVAISNGYTVFYDQNGYATKAIKGVADYTPHKDHYVQSGTYSGGELWTDEEMLTAADRQRVQAIRNQLAAGTIDAATANQMANHIRSGYGYTIDTKGNVTDLLGLSSVDANRRRMGLATGEAGEAQQRYLQLMFGEQGTTDTNALLDAMQALQGGTYDPNYSYAAGAYSAPMGIDLSSLYTGGVDFDAGGYTGMMQLLKNMYEQNLQAELASLKSGYDSDVAELERQNELITQEYQKAQNQAAAQNALERQRMGEVALAQGLNTGASGQFALAQNAALQGSLANLETQRASSIADNHLLAAKLLNQYTGDANKARAEINAQLSSALYDEMVRQQTLAAQQQKATRDDVLTLIAGNVMPSAEMLAEAGMSQQEALLWQALANGGTTAKPADKGTDVQPQLGDNGGYSGNMGLEDWQVREMQRFYGADIDGKWGAQSSTKAGNKNAKDAWDSYQTVVAGYQRELNDDGTFASGGDVASGSYWTGANSSQKGNVTSFDYDPDEGIIVWAGNAYSSLDQVIADINSANLSPQEKEVLRRKMELWFGAGNVSFD